MCSRSAKRFRSNQPNPSVFTHSRPVSARLWVDNHDFRLKWFSQGDNSPQAGEGRPGVSRAASTAIYFLLARGERSHWHRVDAVEVWHWYAGAPLALDIAEERGRQRAILGCDLATGERPQAIVPAYAWQAAQSLGEWTLVGCTVAPGFEFAKFELAPKGWAPQD
jgi:uncharacterized protein